MDDLAHVSRAIASAHDGGSASPPTHRLVNGTHAARRSHDAIAKSSAPEHAWIQCDNSSSRFSSGATTRATGRTVVTLNAIAECVGVWLGRERQRRFDRVEHRLHVDLPRIAAVPLAILVCYHCSYCCGRCYCGLAEISVVSLLLLLLLLLLLHRISTYLLGFEQERRVGGIVAPRVQLGGQPRHHAAPSFGLCIARRV